LSRTNWRALGKFAALIKKIEEFGKIVSSLDNHQADRYI